MAAPTNKYQMQVVDDSGNLITDKVQGMAANGAAASGNPLLIGGVDASGNVVRLPFITPADGDTLVSAARVSALQRFYNGSTVDIARNNIEGTALVSAARTGSTNSSDITNYNARGIKIFLNVTVASGAGGLQVTIQEKDPTSAAYKQLNSLPTAVVATGTSLYLFYPGVASTNTNNTVYSAALPRTFRVSVIHGNTDSYTYSVGYCLIN